ncbi:hypothetical protein [Prescottella agglutinans]|uniref:Uncharacterized protein n=1 Tax=Prescottella agglutinans TaxID=1644129 RepID=A0ABT6MAS8_9NOCA|nr:hypothetical protein [Prescottella agglutinans]MDH6280985.1 hypothetical protein [Prescottella agglutinans]
MYFTPGWGSLIAFCGTIATASVAVASLRSNRTQAQATLEAAKTRFSEEQGERTKDAQRQSIAKVLELAHVWRGACRDLEIAFRRNDGVDARDKELSLTATTLYRACVESEMLNTDKAVRTQIFEVVSKIGSVRSYIQEEFEADTPSADIADGLQKRSTDLADACKTLHANARTAFDGETSDVPFPTDLEVDI